MNTPFEIANYFLKKSQDTGFPLTPMKLIKLCYIAHGWHLGIYQKPLLDESISAWKYGPVIESLYHAFKNYQNSPIKELYRDSEGNYPMVQDASLYPFLDQVWQVYHQFDAVSLSAMTHTTGTPWYRVWHGDNGMFKKSATIPNDFIKEHYLEKIAEANARRSHA